MTLLLLGISILLSSGRNLFSKKLSDIRFGTNRFFFCQSLLFLFGAVSLLCFGGIAWKGVAAQTWLYALIYGLLLICAQWFYTASLSEGNTALCSTVYSMGFIIPTISGAVLWSEPFYFSDLCGLMCAIAAILFSGKAPKKKSGTASNRYFIPLAVAMLSSGGLGVIQKLQQRSPYAEERSIFLLIAFLIASAISLLASFITKNKHRSAFPKKTLAVAACIGFFFGCCNLLNTVLAGRLDSAVFFPTLNIGVILLTLLCSIVFYKEKIKRNELFVLLLGSASILLLNIR
jgi:drug/metabolite transporter (DMT)-like permease